MHKASSEQKTTPVSGSRCIRVWTLDSLVPATSAFAYLGLGTYDGFLPKMGKKFFRDRMETEIVYNPS
jgi:hypothetical protein